jgi:hypothetical protein
VLQDPCGMRRRVPSRERALTRLRAASAGGGGKARLPHGTRGLERN